MTSLSWLVKITKSEKAQDNHISEQLYPEITPQLHA